MISARGDEASSGSDTVPHFAFAKGTWMPTERLAMRHVRDVIRLRSAGMATHEIARRMGTAPSTVRLTIRRFEAAGLCPLSDDITDTELEAWLFASAGAGPGTRRGHRRQAEQDWEAVHRERRRKHVTLSGRARRVSLFALCCGQIYVVAAGVSQGFRQPPRSLRNIRRCSGRSQESTKLPSLTRMDRF